MKKYVIIGISALLIEICSTFYIRSVAESNTYMMLFFAAISPFLGLPSIGYMVETTVWSERMKQALALSVGYSIGALIVINLINTK